MLKLFSKRGLYIIYFLNLILLILIYTLLLKILGDWGNLLIALIWCLLLDKYIPPQLNKIKSMSKQEEKIEFIPITRRNE